MCEKCVELDGRIDRYEQIRSNIGDQLTVDRIKTLVIEMTAEKAALHAKESLQ